MTFDKALRLKLKEIKELNNKVYPVIAPEGVRPPFLVYRKSRSKLSKDLSGIINDIESTYEHEDGVEIIKHYLQEYKDSFRQML